MKSLIAFAVRDRVVMSAIVANTSVLVLRGFPEVEAGAGYRLQQVEYGLTLFFVFEMAAKLWLSGWRAFWARGWNRFDLIVVIATAPMLLSPWVDLPWFGSLMLMRLARLLRLLRAFRFIPDGERLWSGVSRALKASVGVFLALLIYNLVLGMGAHVFFRERAPEHFANPILSMYSVFKVLTLEGWFEIPDAIAAGSTAAVATFARLFFVFTVLSGGVLGLSLANAVFVDEMVMDNANDLEASVERLRAELREAHRSRDHELSALRQRLDALLAELRARLPPPEAASGAAAPVASPPP